LNTAKYAGAPETAKARELISLLEGVTEWAEPVRSGRRTYDDKKFFTSLKKQLDEGRPLSEKQIAAFGKLAARYAGRLDGGEKIADLIGVDAKSAEPALPPENAKEIETMLETLSKISKWAEPVKKGRRVYDDKDFFESLNRQYASRKNLSPKQVAALKRLAAKYADKT
jgi:DNA topoisomerase-1